MFNLINNILTSTYKKKLDGGIRGFAFGEFVNVEEAENAFESLQNTHFYGRRLLIEYSKEE